MPADPPCPDLDALEQALAGMTPDLPERLKRADDLDRNEWIGLADSLLAGGIVAAVNALPGLIAEVRRLRAALGEACGHLDRLAECVEGEGYGREECGGASVEQTATWRALAAPARTDEAT